MMKHEFEAIVGYEVSNEDYRNIIEPMYMATELSKAEFAKTIDRKRFEVKPQRSEESIRLEEQYKADIANMKEQIKYYEERISIYKAFYEDDNSPMWKDGIKAFRAEIKKNKAQIDTLRFAMRLSF